MNEANSASTWEHGLNLKKLSKDLLQNSNISVFSVALVAVTIRVLKTYDRIQNTEKKRHRE